MMYVAVTTDPDREVASLAFFETKETARESAVAMGQKRPGRLAYAGQLEKVMVPHVRDDD
jgi:hypothetical protein